MYRESVAPIALRERVECFWAQTSSGVSGGKRVTPDGCADIIYTRANSESSLSFVGTMTRFQDFALNSDSCVVGVRFRPGMWNDILRIEGSEVINQVLPLADLWSKRGRKLLALLDGTESPSEFLPALARAVPPLESPRTPLQAAIGALEASHGRLSLDAVAGAAGLSTRQFRRLCLGTTGVSPKLLARILRFRYAAELAPSMPGQHAGLSYECGYADQSHLIAEFQEFAGQTPREMAAAFRRSEQGN